MRTSSHIITTLWPTLYCAVPSWCSTYIQSQLCLVPELVLCELDSYSWGGICDFSLQASERLNIWRTSLPNTDGVAIIIKIMSLKDYHLDSNLFSKQIDRIGGLKNAQMAKKCNHSWKPPWSPLCSDGWDERPHNQITHESAHDAVVRTLTNLLKPTM